MNKKGEPFCICCRKNVATIHTNNYNTFCKVCADALAPKPYEMYKIMNKEMKF
jgi:hypothetical protein